MNEIIRSKPCIPESSHSKIMERWEDILQSQQFIQGKYVNMFEQSFREYIGTDYAIATNSGASALEVAIRATGLHGHGIIVGTNTFAASISAIVRSGNRPIIADINEDDLCLGIDQIKELQHIHGIGAVMMVHMAGVITRSYKEIQDLCKEKGWYLIEDASHAVGSQIDGIKAGNIGDIGCFSLYASKIITSGEGGMITTNNEQIAVESRILRNHGCVRNDDPNDPGIDYGVTCKLASCNYRMPELSAALGETQVEFIDRFVGRRGVISAMYDAYITNPLIIKPNPGHMCSYWQYIIVASKDIPGWSRVDWCRKLRDHGIPTANAYYPACHEQPAFQMYKSPNGYPVADDVLLRHIALPMHVELEVDQIKYICSIVNELK
jgi:perosamine synthetase